MRFCPRCHGRFEDASRFCPNDGLPLPSDDNDTRIGSVLYGQFELREVCGQGAMGTVYKAWQTGMERQVAIKVMRPELTRDPAVVKRFDREARAVARLHHPNIVTFFLIGTTDDGLPFLAMEFVEGQSIEQLAEPGPMAPDRALRIARQVSSALADAHAEGVVHRDLKPANILVAQRRRIADFVKVLDFGIAKILRGDHDGAPDVEGRLSKSGSIFGTPAYMAPEQAAGGEVDHRADLYSLGVILYELLTGTVPFEGTGVSVLVAHMQLPPEPPSHRLPGLDPRLEALVMRALEKDPALRFQSAEEMSDAIEEAGRAIGADQISWPSFSGRMPAARPSSIDGVAASPRHPSVAQGPAAAVAEVSPLGPAAMPPGGLFAESVKTASPPPAVPASSALLPVTRDLSVSRDEMDFRPSRRGLWLAGAGAIVVAAGIFFTIKLLRRPAMVVAKDAAAVVTVFPPGDAAAPQPNEPALRRITVGEAGYAVRVLMPARVQAGVEVEIGFDVIEPSGEPSRAPSLAASIEDANDVEQKVTLAAAGAPGHYLLKRSFAYGGRYHVHVFPIPGEVKVHIWFDFTVVGDEPPPAKMVVRAPAPTPKSAKREGSGETDPYPGHTDKSPKPKDKTVPNPDELE